MANVTYTDEPHGFGFTYDEARIACIVDPSDPRLAAAWSSRIDNEVAASALLTVAGTTVNEIATGTAYSVLVTTDSVAAPTDVLNGSDWEDRALSAARDFMEKTGAAGVDAYQVYWRGFPILQLTARPRPEAPAPRILEEIGMLYTPQQTFTSLVVWPSQDRTELGAMAREIWDGFHLVPLEREGRMRTGHRLVRHLRIATETDDAAEVDVVPRS